MRGRKPTPASIRALRGDVRLCENPQAVGQVPDCPEWMEGAGRQEWERIVPLLASQGILSEVDCMTLAAYCQAYASWRECELTLQREGLCSANRLHPLARHSVMLLGEIRRLAAEFGFSPAARCRIDRPPDADDAFSDFMGRKEADDATA